MIEYHRSPRPNVWALIGVTAFLVGCAGVVGYSTGRQVRDQDLRRAFSDGYTVGLVCAGNSDELACQPKSLASGGAL